MSRYPGENTDLPKTLLGAISKTPLNHLVPKDGLSTMIDESLVLSLLKAENIKPSAEHEESKDGISLKTPLETEQDKIIFKKPGTWLSLKNNDSNGNMSSLFDGLSPLAMKCLKMTTEGAPTELEYEDEEIINETLQRKRKISEDFDPRIKTSLDLTSNIKDKRPKVGCSVTVNKQELGREYINEFNDRIKLIDLDVEEPEMVKAENWINIGDDSYVLNEKYLSALLIVLRNIMSTKYSWDEIENEKLIKVLETLTENIRKCSRCENHILENITWRISHLSCSAIFMILQSDRADKRLLKEQYVLEPINFINDDFEKLKEVAKNAGPIKERLTALSGSIGLLPSFLKKRPMMDESLIAKIVYLFCNILMSDEFESSNILQVQTYKDNVKSTSTDILINLFQEFSDQREFIIEELISNLEKMPVKRTQKRLRKLDNVTFVTDFTITIVLILETFSYYSESRNSFAKNDNVINEFELLHNKNNELLNFFTEQISENIVNKFVQNASKYRYALETYIHDLIALLPSPNWSISQYLLSVITRKLLLLITNKTGLSANAETICLHVLGLIGASIFDIKCETPLDQQNNSIRLCNYPDLLPQYLGSFRKCIYFVNTNSAREAAASFLWHQRLGILLKLWNFSKEEMRERNRTTELILNEFENIYSPFEAASDLHTPSTDIRKDYFSLLHSFELLDLYDSYLKVVLSLLRSEKVKVRSTAIKCLSMLAIRDQTILSSPMVKETIEKALSDSSASVKDAILDLISIGFVCIDFYKQVNMNFDHESISVRKHVLKINKMIYDKSDTRNVRVFVASHILLKIEDEEETIIDSAKNILFERWIVSILKENSTEIQIEVCKDVISIMSGVCDYNEKTSQYFEWFLNFFLLNKATHSSETYNGVIKCLNQLTNVLVQRIVELQGADFKSEATDNLRKNCLNLLAKFSDSYVSFITKDHIIALYPYLLSDNSSDLHYYILLVFKNTIPKVGSFKSKFLYDLETTLLTTLPRMNVREINEAMPLVWQVATQRGDTSRVTKACSSCFQHLNPYIKQANSSVGISVEGKLQRLLYLAAGFARFCNFNGKHQKPQFVNDKESTYAYVAKCLLVLSHEKIPHLIRRISIKNLTELCCAHPKLFNSKLILELLDKELEEGLMDVKLVILECLYDFFTLEERKSIRKTGVSSSVSSNKALKAKVLEERKTETVNDGICSALISRFLKNILKVCLSEDIKSSLVAVRLLKLVLQYGYTNPSHCIPTIIALLGSTNNYMSFIATEIMKELFQRYETMVFSGISQGIKIGLQYSEILEKNGFYKNCMFLKRLKYVVSNGKKNSSKYTRAILKVLKMNFDRVMNAQCDIKTRDTLLFLLSNLANFEFATQNELMPFLREIDLASEQFYEAIEDELSENENEDTTPLVLNTATIQKCLSELKSYLLLLYGLKAETLSDQNEDFETKNKPLNILKSDLSFISMIDRIIQDSKSEEFLKEYRAPIKN